MKKIIKNTNLADYSETIEKAIAECEAGCEIEFEPGEYYVSRYITVSNKENLTINGNGALFVTRYDRIVAGNTAGLFVFNCCCGITVKNLKLDTNEKINSTARIKKKDPENLTYEMKLENGFSMENGEIMEIVESFDDNLIPDYTLTHYARETVSYENIGDNTMRVKLTENHKSEIENAKIGQWMCIRHGKLNRPAMHFHACKDAKVENIHIYSTNNVIVMDVCENFTAKNISVRAREGCELLMNTVRDGIWINGLRGKLEIDDCHFERLGDDAVNVHSKGKKTISVCKNVIKFEDTETPAGFGEKGAELSAWARKGDILDIHDSKSFEKKCSVTVSEYKCGEIIFEGDAENVKPGDVICNTAFYCAVEIKNTSAKNSRARGILIQTRNVLVENCEISDMALAGVIIAPDMKVWYELGPSANVTFRNNKFINCCNDRGFITNGVICIQRAHDAPDMTSENQIHKNITFENNIFSDCPVSILHAEGVDGLVFKNNKIENCANNALNSKERKEKLFNTYGCKNVEISGN